ncbi:DUF3800 domain-containing protein [Pseudodesulfovibrio sp. F-1]|uniref:DUF3800 domain-containing protein n=1 Tax=Pseudodesulfovibrio alkaliphilus TaxID=2661613 RepID=A0A7K1KSA6_9BACT|nr:DUF3800 domain-containing protein [Pseudodesulfovibrio alkaliphilus]MUM78840.1 DUF3800 domain-containing protein [Pseudodesulfovibrio alkaliphilus]
MSYLLFIDESGQDRRDSPYEVLAGVAIEDKKIWPLVQCINSIQEDCFGVQRYREFRSEAKGTKILKRKTFKQAATYPPIANPDRKNLACAMLADGTRPAPMKLAALAQAKIAYVEKVFEECLRYDCRAFSSIVPQNAARPEGDAFLRKDYTYLFERFAHMLNQNGGQSGIIVFDELDKSQSHLLINQMENYFLKTQKGQSRAKVIVPEPLFVHSDLTTMVQVVDLIAYVVAWGVRLKGMQEAPRGELDALASQVLKLRYYHRTPGGFDKWGFKLIEDLRTQNEVKKEEGNAACATKPPQ